jgi:nucleoid-associated protein YgaU
MAPVLRSIVRLGLWAAALVATLRVLAATGGGSLAVPVASARDLRAWVAGTPPPDMAIALLRLGALGLTGYLLAVTALGVAARVLRLDGLAAAVERVSPRLVRRMVSGGSGIGLALGVVAGVAPGFEPAPGPAGPAVAAAAPSADGPSATLTRLPAAAATMTRVATTPGVPGPAATPAQAGSPPGTAAAEATMTRLGGAPPAAATITRGGPDTPPGPPSPRASPAGHDPASRTPARPASPTTTRPAPGLPAVDPTRWVVEPGDSLWAIAEEVTRRPDGSSSGERAVSRYWQRLIAANRHDLIDPDNPDLLVPGQRLVVPPPQG